MINIEEKLILEAKEQYSKNKLLEKQNISVEITTKEEYEQNADDLEEQ